MMKQVQGGVEAGGKFGKNAEVDDKYSNYYSFAVYSVHADTIFSRVLMVLRNVLG